MQLGEMTLGPKCSSRPKFHSPWRAWSSDCEKDLFKRLESSAQAASELLSSGFKHVDKAGR
eukprot:13327551-Alexandrium_andersonii.AAC.1